MLRKLTLILLILLVLGGGSYAVLLLGAKKAPAPIASPKTGHLQEVEPLPVSPVTLIEPSLPEVPEVEPQLVLLTSEGIVDYWINQLDAQAYYITAEGVIKRADRAGNPTTLTSSLFEGGVDRISASPRGDAVIINGLSPVGKEFKIYDIERAVWRALPIGTTAAAWSPVSPTNEIIFLSANGSLNVYSLTKGVSRTVMNFPSYDLEISWPTTNTAILSQRPSAGVNGSVWTIDLKKKTIQPVLTELPGLWTTWRQDGALAFDTKNGSYLFNAPETLTRLPFLAAPSKCSRDGLWLFCAVTYAGVTKKDMPDNYLQGVVRSLDNFVSLSLVSLPRFDAPVSIFNAEENKVSIDAWHLTKSGSYLYFVNRYDQKLYSLKLVN